MFRYPNDAVCSIFVGTNLPMTDLWTCVAATVPEIPHGGGEKLVSFKETLSSSLEQVGADRVTQTTPISTLFGKTVEE